MNEYDEIKSGTKRPFKKLRSVTCDVWVILFGLGAIITLTIVLIWQNVLTAR